MRRKKNVSLRYKSDSFWRIMERQRLALGFNDVRLQTDYSTIMPKDVDITTKFSRNVSMNVPIVSSPMDTVTEGPMASAMAKHGGLGIIHRNLTPEDQVKAVERVKHELSAFIRDPVCIRSSQTVREVLEMIKQKEYKFRSFPVKDTSDQVIGIASGNTFEFCSEKNRNKKIADIMTKDVIGAPEGTNVEKAYHLMMRHQIKILPIFNRQKDLVGIYTLADVKRIVAGNSIEYNLAADGTLRVGAAIGVGDDGRNRMGLLAKAKVDVVVIDTAHGDTASVIEMLKWCKRNYPGIDVVAGNVSRGESAKRLAAAGADGIRVGQGPGSICTTRITTGVGRSQATAINSCASAVRGSGVIVIGDGGITWSGDITVALAAGAHVVMIGSLFAGTTESPGPVFLGPNNQRVKVYRGMGSLGAMKENRASRERYKQDGNADAKLVPEGVEGEVSFKGDVSSVLEMLIGGLRAGMAYCGAKNIDDLHRHADFDRNTDAGLRESHPHGLDHIKKAPNYGG